MTTRAMSILVHSDTKVGKSTFGNTTPAPRLLLDAEAAYRFLPGVKVFWDPLTEAPPALGQGRISPSDPTVYSIDWDVCVAIIRTYNHLTRAYEWLNAGKHPFKSVTIDSISEIQTKCKDDLANEGRMSIQLWGDLLTHMERLVRGFRDLTEHPTNPLEAVVLTAMTQMRDGKFRPYVQGQLQVKEPVLLENSWNILQIMTGSISILPVLHF